MDGYDGSDILQDLSIDHFWLRIHARQYEPDEQLFRFRVNEWDNLLLRGLGIE